MLIDNPKGPYHFLKGIEPYSCGVIAPPGWEIVRVTLGSWTPWRAGFELVEETLKSHGLGRTALCALELRSPEPFTMDGFIEFNRGYCAVLEQWQLLVDGLNPIARTNVAPVHNPPSTPSLHAFSFVRRNPTLQRCTFVVAGAGELRDGILEAHRIVRRGETTAEAMVEKAAYVLDVMQERLTGLGVSWQQATAVDIYTAHPLVGKLRELLLNRLGPAAQRGLCWHVTYPPVRDIEFEMDVRGVACEINL